MDRFGGSGPGAETQLNPTCYILDVISREERPGSRGYPGHGQALGSFCPGDHLHLAVNCLATAFSSLSQLPYSTCQGIFLASY